MAQAARCGGTRTEYHALKPPAQPAQGARPPPPPRGSRRLAAHAATVSGCRPTLPPRSRLPPPRAPLADRTCHAVVQLGASYGRGAESAAGRRRRPCEQMDGRRGDEPRTGRATRRGRLGAADRRRDCAQGAPLGGAWRHEPPLRDAGHGCACCPLLRPLNFSPLDNRHRATACAVCLAGNHGSRSRHLQRRLTRGPRQGPRPATAGTLDQPGGIQSRGACGATSTSLRTSARPV
jgi:hypothetical protein